MRCNYSTLPYQIYDKPLYRYLRDRGSSIGYPEVDNLNRENYEGNTKRRLTRMRHVYMTTRVIN